MKYTTNGFPICETDNEFWNEVSNVWDSSKNDKDYKCYTRCSNKLIWVKCTKVNYHGSYTISCANFSKGQRCSYCANKKVHPLDSFAQWGIDNVDKDFLEKYWDNEKNIDINPWSIKPYSSIYVWIKCNAVDYHDSYKTSCSNFIGGNRCPYCSGKGKVLHPKDSFAQYHIDNTDIDFLNKYWDWNNNNKIGINPWEIRPQTNRKFYIYCQEKQYHGSYIISGGHFTNNKRCPYCLSKKMHPSDSFAQYHIDNTDKDFLKKYWDYSKNNVDPWAISPNSNKHKVWIKCQEKEYHESYEVKCSYFTQGSRCSYCHKHNKVHLLDSLGSLYPQVFNKWSTKNKETPYDFSPYSTKAVWWKCPDDKHDDFKRSIKNSSSCDFRCSECTRERNESILQEKVSLYLKDLGYIVLHEYDCILKPINPKTNYHLPFDNEVVELKLIIEVHGEQHYEICTWHKQLAKKNKTTPQQELEYQQWKDKYKKEYALSKGYEYLEIPYWTEKDDGYKELINNKIKEIISLT